tara:strand:- start:47 stop:478 length:432 start_codon:yes stop_codon:yes gene_type:complete
MTVLRLFLLIILTIYIFGCTEKTTYSGKIITQDDLTNINLSNKNDLIEKFGQPSYIDITEKKYFYYTEKNTASNFYNQKTEYSYLFIFEIDENGKIIKTESINLLDLSQNSFQKKETQNNIIERGLLEKIFGGVGPNQLPNSP